MISAYCNSLKHRIEKRKEKNSNTELKPRERHLKTNEIEKEFSSNDGLA